MRKTLLFTSIIAGTSAISSAAFAGNAIDSLFFKAESSEIVSDTSYGNTRTTYNTAATTAIEDNTETVSQAISYGINDRLSAKVAISHDNSNVETSTAGYITLRENTGFQNPTIDLEYRVANQKDDGFYADLKFGVSPDITTAKTSTTTNKGTKASGNDQVSFGLSYGRDVDNVSYKINLDTIYNTDGAYQDADTAAKTTTDASTDFSFGLETQYRATDTVSIDLDATKTIVGSYTKATSANALSTVEGGNVLNIGAAINYVVSSDIALTLAYDHDEIDDSTNSTLGTSVTNAEADAVSVNVRYRF